jgi:hypothetical protein
MRARTPFLAVVLTLLFALDATAGTLTFGPVPDFAGYLTQTTNVTVPTEFNGPFHIPGDGYVSIHIHDSMNVMVTKSVPVYVPSYVRIKIVGDPQIEDPLSFFDIYAQDLDPVHPGTTLTGFNATNPEIIPLSAEKFIGLSGTEYMAPVQAVYLGDLPMVFPDFDLSAFAGGSPGSIVYVAGPGNLPAADAIVPEPGMLALLGTAAAAVAGWVWRRRRAAS